MERDSWRTVEQFSRSSATKGKLDVKLTIVARGAGNIIIVRLTPDDFLFKKNTLSNHFKLNSFYRKCCHHSEIILRKDKLGHLWKFVGSAMLAALIINNHQQG